MKPLVQIINARKKADSTLMNPLSNTFQFLKENLSPKALGMGLVGMGMYATASNAQVPSRFVDFDADPAAFGINGETIDMTEFEVQYFRIPTDDNIIGFRMHNRVKPNDYVEIRGIIPLAPGETFTIDGVAALPYITVDPSTIGSVAPPTEMPGSNPGVDNIYELDSSMALGSIYFRLRDNQGIVNFYLDLDGDPIADYDVVTERSVLKWNRIPDGYPFTTPLATFNTYYSSQGNPPGWSPGQLKNWRILWMLGLVNDGEIDVPNAEIRYARESAGERTTDNETFSAMIASNSSPFKGQRLSQIPDAYLLMVRLQNNSDIYSTTIGGQVPVIPIGIHIGSISGAGWGMYAPGADDGSGVFPGSVNLGDVVQQDNLDADGSAHSTIYEPPIATQSTSWGELKSKFQYGGSTMDHQ